MRPVRGQREFGVLGPLRVRVGGEDVSVTAPRQRVVLGVLLVSAGRPVSAESLIDRLWGETPPATARVTVQNYVKRLRSSLGPDCIETTAEGYRMSLTVEELDLFRFDSHVDRALRATKSGEAREAVEHYREAVALWRGQPLPDLASAGWLESEVAALVESHVRVVEAWAESELEVGGAADVVGPLTELARRWPLRESLRALLIRALHGCGRTADALAEYTRARNALVEELAIDPGEQLRAAHRSVLLPAPRGSTHQVPPAQLPAVSPWLVGRDDAIARLDELVDETAVSPVDAPAGVIAAISGTAGVGKTTLAVHWARRAARRFAEGQLYVNLRGYDPAGPPMDPGEALVGFLGALGVTGQAVPADLASRSALFRTLVASRRLLVVLDNARDVDQVRPLLPGPGGSVAVVTSRDRLTALVAVEGARSVDLGLLTSAQAADLLRQRLGAERVEADPEAVRVLTAECAGLPLALAIAAARADQSQLTVAELAAQLADPRRSPLEVLRSGDSATDVRDVMSWSVDALRPEAARTFRLLGLHPGPDFTPEATADLVARDRRLTHACLDELVRAQLLIEHRPGRYAFHDLLRAYAIELSAQLDSPDDQQAAVRRFLEHLTDATIDAYVAIRPSSDHDLRRVGRRGRRGRPLVRESAEAREWLQREDRVIAAATRLLTGRPGLEHFAPPLVYCSGFERTGRGELAENLALHSLALTHALRSGDVIGEAWIRLGFGTTHTYLGSMAEALVELRSACELGRRAGDTGLQAAAHMRLAAWHGRQGVIDSALHHSEAALDLYVDDGNLSGEAHARNNVGYCLSRAGEHERAEPHCVDALTSHRRRGDHEGMACTLDSLGHIYLHLGRRQEALGCYAEAVDILAGTGRHLQLADVVWHLGDAYDVIGDHDAALASWRTALEQLERLDHPHADLLRAKVRGRTVQAAAG